MMIEFYEWAAPDQFGAQEYMGEHLYTEDQAVQIINHGGALETGVNFIVNIEQVRLIFAE